MRLPAAGVKPVFTHCFQSPAPWNAYYAKAGSLGDAVDAMQRVPANHAMNQQCQLVIAEILLAHQSQVDSRLLKRAELAVNTVLHSGQAV